MADQSTSQQQLELDADQALFGAAPGTEPALDGIVAAIYENERPLRGLSGLLDWRFHGAISRYLKEGALTGKLGECVYLPQSIPSNDLHQSRICHLILIGAGPVPTPGQRPKLDANAESILRKNLKSLKIEKMGLSRSDLGLSGNTGSWKDLSLRILK